MESGVARPYQCSVALSRAQSMPQAPALDRRDCSASRLTRPRSKRDRSARAQSLDSMRSRLPQSGTVYHRRPQAEAVNARERHADLQARWLCGRRLRPRSYARCLWPADRPVCNRLWHCSDPSSGASRAAASSPSGKASDIYGHWFSSHLTSTMPTPAILSPPQPVSAACPSADRT